MNDVVILKDSKNAIRQQAAEWLVKIDGDALNQHEQQALNDWVDQSPAHREILTEMAQNIDRLSAAASKPSVAASRKPVGFKYQRWIAGIAAIFALVVLIPLVNHVSAVKKFTSLNGEYVTQVGGQQVLKLVDGSVVTLNTNSVLQVEYGGSERLLHLLRGEANFDVAPDPKHPFIVRAGNGDVQALGTSFAVRLNDDEVNVLVSHGTVRVRADKSTELPEETITPSSLSAPSNLSETEVGAKSVVVSAGKRVIFEENVVETVKDEPLEEVNRHLYWKKGYLAFKDQPLNQVVEEVSRYTTFKIELSTPELGDIRVGGYYPIDNLDTVFSSLEINLGLKIEKQGDNTYLIKQS